MVYTTRSKAKFLEKSNQNKKSKETLRINTKKKPKALTKERTPKKSKTSEIFNSDEDFEINHSTSQSISSDETFEESSNETVKINESYENLSTTAKKRKLKAAPKERAPKKLNTKEISNCSEDFETTVSNNQLIASDTKFEEFNDPSKTVNLKQSVQNNDSSDCEWEDVVIYNEDKEKSIKIAISEIISGKENIQQKKTLDDYILLEFRKAVKRTHKRIFSNIQKVQLLGYLFYLKSINNFLSKLPLEKSLMKMIPKELINKKSLDKDLNNFIEWFSENKYEISNLLKPHFIKHKWDLRLFIPIVLTKILRMIGLRSRIVVSFEIIQRQQYYNKNVVLKSKKPNDTILKALKNADIIHNKTIAPPFYHLIEVFSGKTNDVNVIDCVNFSINNIESSISNIIESQIYPIHYILGIDQYNVVNDVTMRYVDDWYTNCLKLRIKNDEFERMLNWFNDEYCLNSKAIVDKVLKKESIKLLDKVNQSNMPNTISEAKNHPIYILDKHLLKFQAIYPPDTSPVANIRDNKLYNRSNLYTLQSKERWLINDGRQIIPNEIPYKKVSHRFRSKKKCEELDLFGVWQTEQFIPPIIENGKIPINKFGNVEIYKPFMQPQGSVHLLEQGIWKIAKKLGIEYAPVVTRWEFNGRQAHPKIEGILIAVEHHKTLMKSYNEYLKKKQQNSKNKNNQLALKLWRNFSRKLLIKEHVRVVFNN